VRRLGRRSTVRRGLAKGVQIKTLVDMVKVAGAVCDINVDLYGSVMLPAVMNNRVLRITYRSGCGGYEFVTGVKHCILLY